MRHYTLNKHICNLESLQNMCNTYNRIDSEGEMFSLINLLADFMQENAYYSFIDYYDNIVNNLINIIGFCNNKNYNFNSFLVKYNEIFNYVKNFTKCIFSKYKIYVHFIGIDKYKLISNIINDKIIFIDTNLEKNNSIKKDEFNFNILVISEETVKNHESFSSEFDTVIYYDTFLNNVFNLTEKLFYNNYDYNYLKNSIIKAKTDSINGIFIGHSYSLNGLNDFDLKKNTINLSLPSQDLYYSIKIAKEIISKNENIKRCYLGTGYWSLYFDLSMSQKDGINRIKNTYYPLFRDSHNYKFTNYQQTEDLSNYINLFTMLIFDSDKLYECLGKIIYDSNKSYFNNILTRADCSLIGKVPLIKISENHKINLGKIRAEEHNKLITYTNTLNENIKLLDDFLKYLNSKNVNFAIINFPTTKYYNNYLDKGFKKEYYNIIHNLRKLYNFYFLDLNCYTDTFLDEDFRDLDHIGDLGAIKITKILNKIKF